MRSWTIFAALSLAIAGCTVAEPAAAKCVDPKIVPLAADKENGGRFGTGSRELKTLRANVHEAFVRACRKGLLGHESTIDMGALSGRLHLLNAPAANDASFNAEYRDGGDYRLILEYPFVTGNGSVNIPKADEIEEAIHCAVVGATEAEQESSGRCLPD